MPKKVYWDSCTFLALLNQEPARYGHILAIWKQAEKGEIQIVASSWVLAECMRAKAEGSARPLTEEDEAKLDALFFHPFVVIVPVDVRVAMHARRLLRTHQRCRKPVDGAHLATALLMNVDEMHTLDGDDLLHLDGLCNRQDGQPLRICLPEADQPEIAFTSLAAPSSQPAA